MYHYADCHYAECYNAEFRGATSRAEYSAPRLCRFYCIEGTEMRQLGFKVRRLLFLNRY